MIDLILGGARSGKSLIAEQQAVSYDEVTYIATAHYNSDDADFCERIRLHQARRPPHWDNREVPLALLETMQQQASSNRCLLVDCLTLWLNNHLYENEDQWPQTQNLFLECLPNLPGRIILVSNEVGQGIIPHNALARKFVDLSGQLHQSVATIADRVLLVTAGIPQHIK